MAGAKFNALSQTVVFLVCVGILSASVEGGSFSITNLMKSDWIVACWTPSQTLPNMVIRENRLAIVPFDPRLQPYWACATLSLNETIRHSKTWEVWGAKYSVGLDPVYDWRFTDVGLFFRIPNTQTWAFKYSWDLD